MRAYPGTDAPLFIWAERQRARDAEYSRAYTGWVASLPPSQRARLERMGLAEADTSSRMHGEDADVDVARLSSSARRADADDAFQLACAAEAMSEFCHWCVMPPGQRGLNAKAIGQRVIMAMWVLRPDIIGNLSTTEIGALVDARPEVLSRQATMFSRKFGIRGRAQFSPRARKAQSASAKRRARESIEKGVVHGLN